MIPVANSYLSAIKPYQSGLSKSQHRHKTIKLSSNENPLGCSALARQAHRDTADHLHRYPQDGALALRQAIANYHDLPVDQLLCGAGSDELISLLCRAYTREGDEVLYSQYGFLMYPIAAMSQGAIPVAAEEKHCRTDIAAILSSVTDRTKLVFIANPNNPTGSYLPFKALQQLRADLPEHIILVLDGAYAEYVWHDDYHAGEQLVATTSNTMMLRTFSKIYGLAGLRLGWGYGPSAIIETLGKIRNPFNISSPALAAGLAAIEDQSFIEQSFTHNKQWLLWLTEQLDALGLYVYPSAGNFILVRFATAQHAHAACDYLMKAGIIPRATANYGLDDCLRFTIGLAEDNQQVVALLKRFVSEYD